MKSKKFLILPILFLSALSLSLLKNKKNIKQKNNQITSNDLNVDEHNQKDVIVWLYFLFKKNSLY